MVPLRSFAKHVIPLETSRPLGTPLYYISSCSEYASERTLNSNEMKKQDRT
ncbi:hypothetical protein WN55_09836 [Dufourea novaeangliae]|uniref:Uncharacterized protein n=1 Tax=Dufourea novaeangliae TaxID=178035 RepID=A0A154P9J6_DUFNO|nr:hypothetical protein WN55_09836 [Dufourea novaeangliae]